MNKPVLVVMAAGMGYQQTVIDTYSKIRKQ